MGLRASSAGGEIPPPSVCEGKWIKLHGLCLSEDWAWWCIFPFVCKAFQTRRVADGEIKVLCCGDAVLVHNTANGKWFRGTLKASIISRKNTFVLNDYNQLVVYSGGGHSEVLAAVDVSPVEIVTEVRRENVIEPSTFTKHGRVWICREFKLIATKEPAKIGSFFDAYGAVYNARKECITDVSDHLRPFMFCAQIQDSDVVLVSESIRITISKCIYATNFGAFIGLDNSGRWVQVYPILRSTVSWQPNQTMVLHYVENSRLGDLSPGGDRTYEPFFMNVPESAVRFPEDSLPARLELLRRYTLSDGYFPELVPETSKQSIVLSVPGPCKDVCGVHFLDCGKTRRMVRTRPINNKVFYGFSVSRVDGGTLLVSLEDHNMFMYVQESFRSSLLFADGSRPERPVNMQHMKMVPISQQAWSYFLRIAEMDVF